MITLLGDFEHPEKPESSQSRDSKWPSSIISNDIEFIKIKYGFYDVITQCMGYGKPVPIVDPKFLEDRAEDNDAVKAIESRLKVGHNA